MTPPPLLRMRGAAFRYGTREVFAGLDLDVFRGEVLTILGANGCGKSTLLRCLGGALALNAGSVGFDGADLAALDAGARARRIGFLFQQHTPSFPFKVIDVVGMGRAPHLGVFGGPSVKDLELAAQALERVGMLALRDRPYTEISGGERQLVLLARTLAQAPEVILLDEPTAHLDLRHQVQTLQTVGALAAQGVTMVMTSHDPNHAFLFPGRVAMMAEGSWVSIGRAAEAITPATLAATYGIEVGIASVPGRGGAAAIPVCSPWLA